MIKQPGENMIYFLMLIAGGVFAALMGLLTH
jgi:hypothetical protein